MGKLMSWISGKFSGAARTASTERRSEDLRQVTRELSAESQELKATVHRYQREADPLEALMNTLRPQQSRK